MSGLNSRLNWDLVQRKTYRARKLPQKSNRGKDMYAPIPNIQIGVNAPVLIVALKNRQAKPEWWFGGEAYQNLLVTPSSTSVFPLPGVETHKLPLRLNSPTLIRFPDYKLYPYALEIRVAKWHLEMLVEVWKYSGDEFEPTTIMLEEINKKISDISEYGRS
jgi:hypothetical protein